MSGPSERLGYQRTPRNTAEREFAEGMRERGWEVCKRGWPDFFCVRASDGQVILVEVKPYADRDLKHEQSVVMKALAAYGVPCFRWSPGTGFVRIEE